MLSSVLSPGECAECRFCCSFRRQSLWETPLFDSETAEKLSVLYPEARFKPRGGAYTIDIDGNEYLFVYGYCIAWAKDGEDGRVLTETLKVKRPSDQRFRQLLNRNHNS